MTYVDKAKLQDFATKLWNRTKLLCGSPLVATLAEEMLDSDRVYVYTGNEDGYTTGDWYYHDGSGWVSGGVYNAEAISTDTTLTAAGEAADAKATGEAVRGLTYEGHDTSLWAIGTFSSATGATASSTNRIRTEILSGAILKVAPQSGYKVALWVYNASGVYQGVWNGTEAEKSVVVWFTEAVDLRKLPAGSQVRIVAGYVDDSTITTSTQDAVAANIVFLWRTNPSLTRSGAAADAKAVGEVFEEVKAPLDVFHRSGTFANGTDHGLTITWSWPSATISGTRQSTQAIFSVYDNRSALPLGMAAGDRFLLRFSGSPQSVNLQWYVFFWNAAGNTWRFETHTWSGTGYNLHNYLGAPITVPNGAIGMTVQLRVPSGSGSFSGSVSYLELVKMPKRDMATPLLISFIDDDTSGYEYVRKYREACRHNGVFGNYAALTRFMEDDYTGSGWTGPEMRTRLLGYEDEGFGVLLHAYRQSSSDPWSDLTTEAKIAQCREVLLHGLRDLRKYGFVNYNYWVAPYGRYGTQMQRMAREAGVECLISTNNGRHNSMQDYARFFIKRVALNSDDTRPSGIANAMQDVKDAIDATVAAGAGWLIVTTHFNEWGSLTWDSTLDENGFEVGYSRFNEMVQYALNAGLTPMNFPRAWSYYAPILDANNDVVNGIIAQEHMGVANSD